MFRTTIPGEGNLTLRTDMHIAFIRPAAQANAYINNVPLNYVHLSAYLRENGHEAGILDLVLKGMTTFHVDDYIRSRDVKVAASDA